MTDNLSRVGTKCYIYEKSCALCSKISSIWHLTENRDDKHAESYMRPTSSKQQIRLMTFCPKNNLKTRSS